MSLLPSRSDASPPDDAGPRVIGVDSEDADEVLSALSSETARELLAVVHEDPAPPSELADRVDTSLQNAQYHLGNLEDAGAVEVVDTAYSAKGREMDVYAASDQPLVIFAGDEDEGSTLKTALSRFLGAVGLLAAGSLVVQAVFGGGTLLSGLVGLESDSPGGADSGSPAGESGGEGPIGDGGVGSSGGVTETATDVPTEPPPTETATDVSIQLVPTETPQPTGTPAELTDTVAGTPTGQATQTATEPATQTATETVRTVTETATNVTDTPGTPADLAQTAGSALPPGLLFFAGGLLVLGVVAGTWYVRG